MKNAGLFLLILMLVYSPAVLAAESDVPRSAASVLGRGPAVPVDVFGPDIPLLTVNGAGDGSILLVNRSGHDGFDPIDEPFVRLRAALLRNPGLLGAFASRLQGLGVQLSPHTGEEIRAADRAVVSLYREELESYLSMIQPELSDATKMRLAFDREDEALREEILNLAIPTLDAPWYSSGSEIPVLMEKGGTQDVSDSSRLQLWTVICVPCLEGEDPSFMCAAGSECLYYCSLYPSNCLVQRLKQL